MIDTPTEMAPDWMQDDFVVDGKKYHVVVHSFGDEGGKRTGLVKDIEKIVRAEVAMWDRPSLRSTRSCFTLPLTIVPEMGWNISPQPRSSGPVHSVIPVCMKTHSAQWLMNSFTFGMSKDCVHRNLDHGTSRIP